MNVKEFIIKYNLEILTIVNAIIIIYSFINWFNFDMTRNFIVLFMLAITLHEWEEGRYPGGFVELMTGRMGDDIKIEERDAAEITDWKEERLTPEGVTAVNPAFDVTPNKYITAIITDKGIARPPYNESLNRLTEEIL